MKKIHLFGLFYLIFAFVISPTNASAIIFEKNNNVFSIENKTLIQEDIYILSPSLISYGEVEGDLTSAVSSALITGNVAEDINIFGGNIDLLGDVGDDIRVIGGQIRVGGNIKGDVIMLGGILHLLENANVSGDVVMMGGNIIVDGSIGGNLRTMGEITILNGEIFGSANIKSKEVKLNEKTKIGGNLKYSSNEEIKIPEGAEINGEIIFSEIKGFEKTPSSGAVMAFLASVFTFLFLAKIAMLLLPALLAVYLIPKFSRSVAEAGTEKFLRSLGIGLISLVVIPIASVILLASIVGLPIGIAGILFYVFMFIASGIFGGITLGAVLAKWRGSEDILNWKWVVLGVLLFELLVIVPILGWVTRTLFFLVAFGAISAVIYRFLQKRK